MLCSQKAVQGCSEALVRVHSSPLLPDRCVSSLQNDRGQCPADVVPDPLDMPLDMADAAAVAKELRALLRQALPRPSSPLPLLALQAQALPTLSDKARLQLAAMGIRLGERVVIAGQKVCVCVCVVAITSLVFKGENIHFYFPFHTWQSGTIPGSTQPSN